ncbi:MAG: UvrD-helicase domain-containing protein, partial [Clostridia bacterium]|nr:UvrD-helicase domain-containing protein [Clostridia bacterium]
MGMNIDEYCAIHQYSKDIKYVKRVYEDYQAELKKNNAMDFDDLLINFYQLIKNNEIVRESIQNQYRYIHIDEFQDTNSLQYEIVKLLAQKYRNIMIVGDEDQSIYSWRGANIDNIFKFTKDFPECKVIKLEQNYRSTKAVLDKANQLIKNNKNRLDKQLYTQNQQGGEVEFYSGYEESDETDYVIRHIIQAHAQGVPYNEIAILMRVNALTRSFEEKLLAYNIPHKIYNSFKFYDRLEIKNSLAYLISIANPNDNNNLMRLINFPKRSIGEASVEAMMKVADARKCSLKEVVLNSRNLDLKSSLKSKLEPLANLLKDIDEKSKTLSLYELMSYILEESKILDSFDKKNDEDYERFLNVNSLLNSIKEFEQANPDATFVEYLQMVSLTAQIDENNTQEGVVLATVHGVKGLEFNTVFIVGLEEKIFPITRDYEDSLEEERRLMYVAITRAKEKLYITNAKSRFMYGKREGSVPSRFLREIDMIKDKSFDYISPYGEYSNSYERKTTSYYNKEDNSYNDNSSYSNNYSYYNPNKT